MLSGRMYREKVQQRSMMNYTLSLIHILEAEMKEWKQQDEDVLSYALFPQVATDFFKYRKAQQDKMCIRDRYRSQEQKAEKRGEEQPAGNFRKSSDLCAFL